uniref:Lipase_3 domain-containing protein n=1 Tax=Heterorhabditis bacteriophora TaxID=37862 RepID=A0A1I7WU19_HETBA
MTALSVLLKNYTTADKICVVTFGATRVGNISYVELIETMIPYRFRIVHSRDMVVRYPKPFNGDLTPPHHHRYEKNEEKKFGIRIICPWVHVTLSAWGQKTPNVVRGCLLGKFEQMTMKSILKGTLVESGCKDNEKTTKQLQPVLSFNFPAPIYKTQTTRPYVSRKFTLPLLPNTTEMSTVKIVIVNKFRSRLIPKATTKFPIKFKILPWWYTMKAWSTLHTTVIKKERITTDKPITLPHRSTAHVAKWPENATISSIQSSLGTEDIFSNITVTTSKPLLFKPSIVKKQMKDDPLVKSETMGLTEIEKSSFSTNKNIGNIAINPVKLLNSTKSQNVDILIISSSLNMRRSPPRNNK